MSRRVDLGAITLSVTDEGAGPPIIFLHGFPELGRAWGKVTRQLVPQFRCIMPDQRGYNLSDKPDGVDAYSLDQLTADIDRLACALGLDTFALAGHDWGGIVAWFYAARAPHRVSKLLIANAPHPVLFQNALIDDPKQRLVSQYITALRQAGADQSFLVDGPEGLWNRLFAANPAFTASDKAAYMAAWAQPDCVASMLNWYRASPFIVPEPGESVARPAWLETAKLTISVPTLILWGLQDTVLLPSLLNGLDDYVTDLTIRELPQAGHALIHEAPEEIALLIRDFMQ